MMRHHVVSILRSRVIDGNIQSVLFLNVMLTLADGFVCMQQYWKRLCGKEVLPSNRDDESQSALSNPSSSQSEGIFIGGDEVSFFLLKFPDFFPICSKLL